MTYLLDFLEGLRGQGRKLLVPYLTCGVPNRARFAEALAAVAKEADAVEVGLPYSDPLMDGPVIASAAVRALAQGIGPIAALELSAAVDVRPPKVAMTYYNPVHRTGEAEFCRRATKAGFSGVIVPDVPVEESSSLREAAAEENLAWIPLVAPTSPPERVRATVNGATGFVYAVSTLGVTGERERLSERAIAVVQRCRDFTDLPVLVGLGVSTPDQAREAAAVGDGVVIGSAVVKLVLERGAGEAQAFLSSVRAILDSL